MTVASVEIYIHVKLLEQLLPSELFIGCLTSSDVNELGLLPSKHALKKESNELEFSIHIRS